MPGIGYCTPQPVARRNVVRERVYCVPSPRRRLMYTAQHPANCLSATAESAYSAHHYIYTTLLTITGRQTLNKQ